MKIFLLLAVLSSACATNLISTKGKVYQRVAQGIPLNCATITEWNVSTIRQDKNPVGCWCMLPPLLIPKVGATMVFQLAKDEMCQDEKGIVEQQKTVPTPVPEQHSL